jgi:DNA-directed RNA polymerase sigma subunit (sigma70/sigma32)
MEMGLKRERVRQIRKKAERKLRKPFSKMNNVK